MAKIYLIRHGESLANTLGIYQGQTYDTNLSPLGYRQVKALRKYFTDKKVDFIYSSPLIRTRKTAKAVGLATGIRVQLDHYLLETNHGQWEGLSKTEIQARWGDILCKWNIDPAGVSFPDGETFDALQRRVLGWFYHVKNIESDIAYVTHDNVIRVIVAHLKNLPTNKFWDFALDPAGVTIIESTRRTTKIVKLNESDHLRDCLTNLALHAL